MAALRKTKKEKLLTGTLKKSREAARKKAADPTSELEDALEALDAMKQNLRLATAEIAAKGMLVSTTISDSHGRMTVVERPNPALKIQREAMRMITSLKKQIASLREEEEEKKKQDEDTEAWKEFQEFESA